MRSDKLLRDGLGCRKLREPLTVKTYRWIRMVRCVEEKARRQ